MCTHLLVGEDEEDGVAQFVFCKHAHELLSRLADSLAIVAVDDEDQAWKKHAVRYRTNSERFSSSRTLCVLEVVPPQGSDFILAADIPYCETDVFVFYRLHIETFKRSIRLIDSGKHFYDLKMPRTNQLLEWL